MKEIVILILISLLWLVTSAVVEVWWKNINSYIKNKKYDTAILSSLSVLIWMFISCKYTIIFFSRFF